MMNIRKQLYVFLLCLLTYAMNMAAGAEEGNVDFRLTVLHNDDAESQLIDAGPGLEDFGGVARFATLAGKLKTDALRGPGIRSKRGVILLTAGDNIFAGAQFNASLAKGIPFYEAIAMENIGYSVSGLGNHDFDFGPDVLADFIDGFHSLPFVSANLDFQNEPRLQALASAGRLARSVVVKVEGEQIGIIGAITPRLPILATPRNVIVNSNLVEVVESEIERLQGEGVKIIILMTHLQTLDEAKDLIGQLRGIDIVVAAGSERSNELQANPGDLLIPGDVAFAPYPLLVDDADGQKVPLVSTTGNYRYIGQLTVSFDKQGNLIAVDETRSRVFRVAGGNHPDAVKPDNKLQKKVVEPVRAAVDALASNVIATSEVDLDGLETHVRTVETNEGNLVADALLVEARRLAPEFGALAPDVAIANGGAIRNDSIIPAGTISELDTFNIAPFPNLLAIVPNIPPGQFKEIVENAVSQVEFLDGRFAQVSGFRFSWDPAGIPQRLDENGNVVTPGTRIREVSLNDGRVIVTGGAVVMGAPSVTIAVTNFLATGGDQYPFHGTPFANLGISYQQALFNYIVNSLGGFISAADYPESGEGRILKL
jgi:2',3'-cyclic-nucleotide 2'-phosphodiesterase (5'-nucleotidase family)